MGNVCTPAVDYPKSEHNPSDSVQNALKKESVGGIPKSKKVNGRFVIDTEHFPDFVNFGFSGVRKWRSTVVKTVTPPTDILERDLPVLKPDAHTLKHPPPEQMQVTWLGHACALVQWDGWNVLADPVFSHRCAPVQFAGPARVRPSPVVAADLPRVDAIVISHNHYDHLDKNSVVSLARLKPPPMWFVPLGTKEWMRSCGVANVVEMDWMDEATLSSDTCGSGNKGSGGGDDALLQSRSPLTIRCVPCQHWCGRGVRDRNLMLWSAWVCSTPTASYYFGGDSGYCGRINKKLGDLYDGIDVAALPIGAYGHPSERWFHKPNHMNPDEAVQTHLDLKAKQSVGIHWGTFQLTAEPLMEPPQLLEKAKEEAGLEAGDFVVLAHGETRVFEKAKQVRGQVMQVRPSDD